MIAMAFLATCFGAAEAATAHQPGVAKVSNKAASKKHAKKRSHLRHTRKAKRT